MAGAGARIQVGKERGEEDAKTRRKDPDAGSARRAVPGSVLTHQAYSRREVQGGRGESVFVSW